MLKWIGATALLYGIIGCFMAVNSSYTPISQQIDVKTMSINKPEYIKKTWDSCVGSCRDYSSSSSSSSSWGGSSYGGK